jgi:hypothetical protein
LCGR